MRKLVRLLLALVVLAAPYLPLTVMGPLKAHAVATTSPTYRGDTDPVDGLSCTSPIATLTGDMVIVVSFERLGAGSGSTLTTDTGSGFVEIRNHFHNDGSTDGTLAVAYKIATADGAQSYTAFTSSVGTETWTGCIVYAVGTFSTTGIVANSVTATGTGAPNPPAITTLAAFKYGVIIFAAWHLSAGATVTPGAPSTYTLRGHLGSETAELAIATKDTDIINLTTLDPAAWTDDVTPNGTCGITIGIRGASATVDVIQQANADEAGADTSHSVAYPANTTTGSTGFAVFWWVGAGTNLSVSCSDSVNGAWTEIGTELQTTNDGMGLYYRANMTAGATTVTCTADNTYGGAHIAIFEITGADTTTPFDQTNGNGTATAGSGTDNATTNAITPSRNNSLLLAAWSGYTSTTIAAGTGWLSRFEVDNQGTLGSSIMVAQVDQTTATSQAGLATVANSSNYHGRIASFQPPAGGAARSGDRMLRGVGP